MLPDEAPRPRGRATKAIRGAAPAAARINAVVARFVAGQPLGDFRRDFLRFSESFDQDVLPAAQRDAYWAVHDLVCMADPGRTAAPGAGVGALGEAALRDRLRHFHLVEPGDTPT